MRKRDKDVDVGHQNNVRFGLRGNRLSQKYSKWRFVEMLIRIYITWGRVNGRGSERIVHHSGFYVAKILKSFDCFVLVKKHD